MINGQTHMEKEAEGYHNVQTETNEEQWNLEGRQDTEALHLHEDNLVRIHRRVKEATKDDQEREENDNASNEVPNLSIADVNAIQSFFATMNKTGLPVYDLSSSQSPELSSERVGRRSKDAERKRLRRARETPEETRTRLDRASNYKRKKYSTETEEEYKQRLKKQAERKRLERANETEEQANIRRAKAAEHRRLYLQRETFEKTEERKAKDAERRRRSLKNETPEETLIRRAKNAQRRREALLKETPEEAAIRRARDAERRRQYLKSETEEQKAIRKAQDAARKRQIRVMKNQEHTEEQTGELPTSLSEALATLSELSGSFGPIDIRSIINPQIAPQFN